MNDRNNQHSGPENSSASSSPQEEKPVMERPEIKGLRELGQTLTKMRGENTETLTLVNAFKDSHQDVEAFVLVMESHEQGREKGAFDWTR